MSPQHPTAGERPFITVQHPFNRRWAVLEDDGVGAWLYITEPDTPDPVADCLVYSCVAPVQEIPPDWDRKSPPPLTIAHASERAWQPDAANAPIRVAWASNGRAALVLMDGEPVAFLPVGEKQGFTKSVSQPGPYGFPWDDEQFEALFAEHLA